LTTVAFQGERGAFSELAAIEFFGDKKTYSGVAEFRDVFVDVAQGRTRYGIIPIENSLGGSIHQNYDLLLENNLHIIGEVYLHISHFLIAAKGVSRRRVQTVYSHPQALMQCKKYLRRFPSLNVIPVSNTAAAVKKIKDEGLRDAAAIASMQAAIDYDMHVLASEIEDNKHNTTRFIIVSRKPLPKKECMGREMKSSIVFSAKNIPGALFKCLSVFALRDIDLYKIESRPAQVKGFEYLFYLDFKGSKFEEAQKNAINHLQEVTIFYRLLGSYPAGRFIHPHYSKRK
jgi:prephenate dehydratase